MLCYSAMLHFSRSTLTYTNFLSTYTVFVTEEISIRGAVSFKKTVYAGTAFFKKKLEDGILKSFYWRDRILIF